VVTGPHPSALARRTVLRGAGSLGIATLVLPAAAAASTGGQQSPGTSAGQFFLPVDVTVDASGNLYVTEVGSNRIRKVTTSGAISTVAGAIQSNPAVAEDGTGAAAKFNNPTAVAVDSVGGSAVLRVGERDLVRTVVLGTAAVSTLAGQVPAAFPPIDGTGTGARFFQSLGGLTVLDGLIYATDGTIRTLTSEGVVSTLAGGVVGFADGTGSAAQFDNTRGICVEGGNLFVADAGNRRIRRVTTDGVVTTLAGGGPGDVAADGVGSAATFVPVEGSNGVGGIVGDGAGNLFVVDGCAIRKIVIATATVTTVAGVASGEGAAGFVNGIGASARFSFPRGLAYRAGMLYVADVGNHVIRRVDLATAAVTTFAGSTAGTSDSGA
jgi:hypothetical protein